MDASQPMPVFTTLDALTRLVTRRSHLYVRWSRGPAVDLERSSSMDDLTGAAMPGLSASPLDVEEWWEDRPVHVWVARRLYDYSHLPRVKDPRARPWVLAGQERGRGPDNEPLVRHVEPLGWIGPQVLTQATAVITRQPGRWGPLHRGENTP
ncbi:hypothetical protein FM076_02330 [Streptomyces albus subsp. chlorinus]|uniref:DUF6098 family protein n=1 Tax=Streptomyces albus TaxID=1888 RepID=UPI00157155CE|nr:DUF6098 family protein [Streptomyces albus]NSC20106.1 hypothetical protein [Streptomyces albus subsp. chlorinus]